MLNLKQIDNTWTLFLDRDGVINIEKYKEYILNYDEFKFHEGVREAIEFFSRKFGKVIVITNQRGVGRELMTEEDLLSIHDQMLAEIEASGGQINKIYYCTSTDDAHPNRKPNPGMVHEALRDFPSIDLKKSIMVGNKPSDMKFGRNVGMNTVFVRTTNPEVEYPNPLIDLAFDNLSDFAKALQNT